MKSITGRDGVKKTAPAGAADTAGVAEPSLLLSVLEGQKAAEKRAASLLSCGDGAQAAARVLEGIY